MSATEAQPGRAAPDEGQTTPFVALLVVVAVVTALGIAEVGAVLVDRARARTAADAAALAGVRGGREAAEALAAENHAVLEGFAVVDGTTAVVVRCGRARAEAWARPGEPPGARVIPANRRSSAGRWAIGGRDRGS